MSKRVPPITARFDPEFLERLDRVLSRTGMSRSTFIRLATQKLLDEFEDTGVISLPRVAEDAAVYHATNKKKGAGDKKR